MNVSSQYEPIEYITTTMYSIGSIRRSICEEMTSDFYEFSILHCTLMLLWVVRVTSVDTVAGGCEFTDVIRL